MTDSEIAKVGPAVALLKDLGFTVLPPSVRVAAAWMPEDVQTLKPEWSEEECADWLYDNIGLISDISIERGWEAIGDLLPEREV